MMKRNHILKLFLVTESSCDDRLSCHQIFISENIQSRFCVFGLVLDTIKDIRVRSQSVDKEADKLLHFKVTFSVKKNKLIF